MYSIVTFFVSTKKLCWVLKRTNSSSSTSIITLPPEGTLDNGVNSAQHYSISTALSSARRWIVSCKGLVSRLTPESALIEEEAFAALIICEASGFYRKDEAWLWLRVCLKSGTLPLYIASASLWFSKLLLTLFSNSTFSSSAWLEAISCMMEEPLRAFLQG